LNFQKFFLLFDSAARMPSNASNQLGDENFNINRKIILCQIDQEKESLFSAVDVKLALKALSTLETPRSVRIANDGARLTQR
jgi:hypothetical protein